jgi:hypothetical protein
VALYSLQENRFLKQDCENSGGMAGKQTTSLLLLNHLLNAFDTRIYREVKRPILNHIREFALEKLIFRLALICKDKVNFKKILRVQRSVFTF